MYRKIYEGYMLSYWYTWHLGKLFPKSKKTFAQTDLIALTIPQGILSYV